MQRFFIVVPPLSIIFHVPLKKQLLDNFKETEMYGGCLFPPKRHLKPTSQYYISPSIHLLSSYHFVNM